MSGLVRSGLVVIAVVAALPVRAFADDPPPTTDPSNATKSDDLGNAKPDTGSVQFRPTDTIVIKSTPDRSAQNIALLAGVTAVGLAFGAGAVYYHLQSRTDANAVSDQTTMNIPWTPALQAQFDRANSEATRATVLYSIAGAVVIGAVVGLVVTAPQEETTIMHPRVGVAPTRGGANVAASWSF